MATTDAGHDVAADAPPGLDVQAQINELRTTINALTEQNNDMQETIDITKLELEQLREHKNQSDRKLEELKDMVSKMSTKHKDTSTEFKDFIKPTVFSGKDEDYHDWQSTLQDAATTKNRKLRKALQWAKEERCEISVDKALDKIAECGIEEAEDALDKLHMLIKSYCNTEGKMICESTESEEARNGLEAWRLLRERLNPHTPQSENDLQNAILRPERVSKLSDLMQAIESWEEK